MNEGWLGEDYLILFSDLEVASETDRYRLVEWLPDFAIVGLRGWDDFIVRATDGVTYTIPTVPLDKRYLTPFDIPTNTSLKRDDRYNGQIKWHVTPLVFGGDAMAEDNTIWIGSEQHAAAVAWWNALYIELNGSEGRS